MAETGETQSMAEHDTQIAQLRVDFVALKGSVDLLSLDFNKQVARSADQASAIHGHFERRLGAYEDMHVELMEATQRNTAAIEAQTVATAGLVKFESNLQGAAAIGSGVRKVSWFILKVPVIGGVAVAGWLWLLDRLAELGASG